MTFTVEGITGLTLVTLSPAAGWQVSPSRQWLAPGDAGGSFTVRADER